MSILYDKVILEMRGLMIEIRKIRNIVTALKQKGDDTYQEVK